MEDLANQIDSGLEELMACFKEGDLTQPPPPSPPPPSPQTPLQTFRGFNATPGHSNGNVSGFDEESEEPWCGADRSHIGGLFLGNPKTDSREDVHAAQPFNGSYLMNLSFSAWTNFKCLYNKVGCHVKKPCVFCTDLYPRKTFAADVSPNADRCPYQGPVECSSLNPCNVCFLNSECLFNSRGCTPALLCNVCKRCIGAYVIDNFSVKAGKKIRKYARSNNKCE